MRSPPSSSRVGKTPKASRHWRAPARRSIPAPRRRPRSAPLILRRIGAAILVSGWLAASAVMLQASETPGADAVEYRIVENRVYPITLANSKRERQLVQRMDGDLGLWFAQFDAGLRSLLRPPRLAWTLLLLSTAIGLACLQLAKLSAEDVDE